jgi:hypothetical protein
MRECTNGHRRVRVHTDGAYASQLAGGGKVYLPIS